MRIYTASVRFELQINMFVTIIEQIVFVYLQ
jgi:hypothetical protein